MSGNGILLLAANTPRSQAYAQTFAARGITLEQVILFDHPGTLQPGRAELPRRPDVPTTVNLPDLRIPLMQSLKWLARHVHRIEAKNINDLAILEAIQALGPKLVVYSGYGGQMVGHNLLSLGPPFLHAHSGWLPSYRGSTTIYYSLLAEMNCAVSVIQMVPAVDQGPILARQLYPVPPFGIDIDFFYDSAIRADLMANTVANWQTDGSLEPMDVGSDGNDYYVVHPLLKHLALLSLETKVRDEGDAD